VAEVRLFSKILATPPDSGHNGSRGGLVWQGQGKGRLFGRRWRFGSCRGCEGRLALCAGGANGLTGGHFGKGRYRKRWISLRFETLEPRLVLDAMPVITEFMADNATTILDGDGQASDWIEIYNPTDQPIQLEGWYLTDNDPDDDLAEWAFPACQLDPGEYLLVFASNKPDELYPYYDPGGYLHTSFALSAGGENLALVMPDGQTVASAYWDYPEQVEDVSYGIAQGSVLSDTLLEEGAALRYHVPTPGDAALMPDPEPGGDPGWTAVGFDDSSWTATVPTGGADLAITELSTGSPHYVEIENVSDTTIDTSGWMVLVNDASGGINATTRVRIIGEQRSTGRLTGPAG